jgi:hypothetical protein
VELNHFAKALSSETDDVASLADYLLAALTGQDALTHEVFLEWLATYPSLLILDGLDEVPATSNREDVVATVDDFLSEARGMGADIYVVVTSRHQGFAGEFAGGPVALRHVLPLSAPRALRYVEAYADARYGDSDPRKAADVVARLRASAKRQLTAQLMATPLQVTFMATVVAASGDPGEDRWQLFDSYYRTIYDRERQKAVPPYDTVLSRQQATIDRLHHDIGFWLQYRGETAGGPSVSLPIDTFERLVDSYLVEVGHDGADREHLVGLITDAARQRLVFLTSRVAGELSFDVRSLQEYMAAECISSGDPELVKARLRAIGPAPYWRNVFLFAVSKCFADTRSRHLQDSIRLLCEDLNGPTDRLLSAAKSGSDLALDILLSGAVAENPNYLRHMVRISLAMLQEPDLVDESDERPSTDQRLASVYRESVEDVFREAVELRVGQTEVARTMGAWPLVLRLCRQGVVWAEDLFERHWPADMDRLTLLAPVLSEVVHVPEGRRRLEELLLTVPPTQAFALLHALRAHGAARRPRGPMDFLDALQMLRGGGALLRPPSVRIPIRGPGYDQDGVTVRLDSLQVRDEELSACYAACAGIGRAHPNWLPFTLASSLLDAPNPGTLASILDECADRGWTAGEMIAWYLPWPLSVALQAAESAGDLREIADRLRKRDDGSHEDWIAAEKRWASEGITLADPGQASDQADALASLLGGGPPPLFSGSFRGGDYPDSFVRALFDAARDPRSDADRNTLTWLALFAGRQGSSLARCLMPSQLQSLLDTAESGTLAWSENHVTRPGDEREAARWIEFYDWVGRSDRLSPHYSRRATGRGGWCELFQEAFVDGGVRSLPVRRQRPLRLGLLRLLGRYAAKGATMGLIPPEMVDPAQLPDERSKLAGILVRISQHNLSPAETKAFARDAAALLAPPAEEGACELLFRAIEAHLGGNGALSEFLLHLREAIPPDAPLGVARCERLLRRVARSRPSSLQTQENLREFQLPIVPETA